MNYIQLTKEKKAIVDDEDFEWLNQWKWASHSGGYAYRTIYFKGKRIGVAFMHRLIMNVPKRMETDHINGNRLDNRRENLRIVSRQQNAWNVRTTKGKSKFKGVSFMHGKYIRAYINLNNKQIHIGMFQTEIEAALAYDKKAKELFGKFAKLNF